jgi:hypothetical protein
MTSNFIFQLNTCGYSPYVTSSPTRGWVCYLQLLLVLASAVILRSESHGTHNHILVSQIRDSPNLQGQSPLFISPRNRVAQFYPPALGSLFVASYNSQGYGGVIRRRLHMGALPPPSAKSKVKVTLRVTVGQSWCRGPDIYCCFDSYSLVIVGRPLWREDQIENTSHSCSALLYSLPSNELFTKNLSSRELVHRAVA